MERLIEDFIADVKRLLALGLIERDDEKRVFVPWTEIRIRPSSHAAASQWSFLMFGRHGVSSPHNAAYVTSRAMF